MADSSDYSTGACAFCGKDWDICLITTSLESIGITECEHGHPICVEHLPQEIQDLFDNEDDEGQNEYMTGEAGWEVCNTVRSKFCPVCKKLKNSSKTPLTVESLIEKLQKIEDKNSIVVVESGDTRRLLHTPATNIKIGKYNPLTEWVGQFGEDGKPAIIFITPRTEK